MKKILYFLFITLPIFSFCMEAPKSNETATQSRKHEQHNGSAATLRSHSRSEKRSRKNPRSINIGKKGSTASRARSKSVANGDHDRTPKRLHLRQQTIGGHAAQVWGAESFALHEQIKNKDDAQRSQAEKDRNKGAIAPGGNNLHAMWEQEAPREILQRLEAQEERQRKQREEQARIRQAQNQQSNGITIVPGSPAHQPIKIHGSGSKDELARQLADALLINDAHTGKTDKAPHAPQNTSPGQLQARDSLSTLRLPEQDFHGQTDQHNTNGQGSGRKAWPQTTAAKSSSIFDSCTIL
jgi:hypothetical protein